MKKATKLKAFMLSLIMTALLLPMTSFAQQTSDDFFRVGDEFNGNRDVVAWTITNNGIGQSETPLGSGLLILGAIGAGYAIAKRKRNKKGAALLLALMMTLGFTQCKKKIVEPIANNGNTVHITLTMAGGGSKVDVDPTGGGTYATVAFEKGDIIYVGNGGKYVGYVTYNGTNTWEGDLTSPTTDDYLHLYFLGNKSPLSSVTPGTTTEFSVSIADQASKYPVISYNHTLEKYNGAGSYTATTLYNKCSIMKFIVTTGTNYANDPIRITGMNNKVTVDFAKPEASENGFSYSVNTTDGGLIKMPSIDGENITWAIVLPQEALAAADDAVYTNGYKGNRPTIVAIERNTYYNSGVNLTIETEDASKIKDLSTVSENWTAEDGWTLTGTLGANVKISIAPGATVTLDGATINGTNSSSYKWAGLNCNGDATIILKDGTTNTVKGFHEDYPGIHVPAGSTLTIMGETSGTGKLVASSNTDGSLSGAGIGGGWNLACGNIEIQGGDITATGSAGAAGIGSNNMACGNITISGGTVSATGGASGAGIGSGLGGSCGLITISGGTVNATGGDYSAGIGSGKTGSCGAITIGSTVTRVTVTKGDGASYSIGAGYNGSCGTVTIGGVEGAISTSPYTYPAPVENIVDLSTLSADYTANTGDVLINTLGENHKISIAAGATVTLDNASINAAGTWTTGDYAGITCLGNATIILSGTNTVKGFYDEYPGIHVPSGSALTIQGTGSLNASSNGNAAGIGGGFNIACGNIEIQGGTINATGGFGAAGIGAGANSTCGSISITNGTVVAHAGDYAAGIGAAFANGNYSTCSGVSISGGSVTAYGGPGAAGIGSALSFTGSESYSQCGDISITGGTVVATGGNSTDIYHPAYQDDFHAYGGAGIGTGATAGDYSYQSNCGNITIGAGVTSVTATKGNEAQNSIGKNHSDTKGTCGTVTIEDPSKVTQN